MTIGICSESTRYIQDKHKNILNLYKDQTWVYPIQLHITVKTICQMLTDSISDDLYILCDSGAFSKKNEEEIFYCIEVMKKYSSKFAKLNKMLNHTSLLHGEVSIFKNRSLNDKIVKKIFYQIEKIKKEDLAPLCKGLSFISSQLSTKNLNDYKKWKEEALIQNIFERIHHYKNAICKLEKFYYFIKKNRLKRGFYNKN